MCMQALYQHASSLQKLDAQQAHSEPTLTSAMQSATLQGFNPEVNEVSLQIVVQPLQYLSWTLANTDLTAQLCRYHQP